MRLLFQTPVLWFDFARIRLSNALLRIATCCRARPRQIPDRPATARTAAGIAEWLICTAFPFQTFVDTHCRPPVELITRN
jgi:hypothetical protein